MSGEVEQEPSASSSIEVILSEWDVRIASAEQRAAALLTGLRRLAKLCRVGEVRAFAQAAQAVRDQAAILTADLAGAIEPPPLDLPAAFADGRFAQELAAALEAAGGRLVRGEGNRLFAFPHLLELDAKGLALRIGRRRERNLRPSLLAKRLATLQNKERAFAARRFLDLLVKPYRLLAQSLGHEWRPESATDGPFVPLADIHDVLSLHPTADYPLEAFVIDLLQLDAHPDAATSAGHGFALGASSGTRGRKHLSGYDREARRRDFFALRFLGKSAPATAPASPPAGAA